MTCSHDTRARRRHDHPSAFTLTELLVVIMVIALLASMVLFTMAGVQQEAKERRTLAQVARLHELIMVRWESYQTRRVQTLQAPLPGTVTQDRYSTAKLRVDAIRELMRMELPDRITDVMDPPEILAIRPALSRAYLRRASPNWSPTYQEAECLYMIVSRIQVGDGNGLEFLFENEKGDVDGDGMPEILDSWGNPIEFLRWAPGFASPLQPQFLQPEVLMPEAPMNRDPFDPTGVYPGTFALYPLIFSAGPDGQYQVNLDDYVVESGGVKRVPIHYSQTGTTEFPEPRAPNNPFVRLPKSGLYIGTTQANDEGFLDNINNHSL